MVSFVVHYINLKAKKNILILDKKLMISKLINNLFIIYATKKIYFLTFGRYFLLLLIKNYVLNTGKNLEIFTFNAV